MGKRKTEALHVMQWLETDLTDGLYFFTALLVRRTWTTARQVLTPQTPQFFCDICYLLWSKPWSCGLTSSTSGIHVRQMVETKSNTDKQGPTRQSGRLIYFVGTKYWTYSAFQICALPGTTEFAQLSFPSNRLVKQGLAIKLKLLEMLGKQQ